MPRKVELKIVYENREVTKEIEKYLISLTYTDSTEKADTLSLELYNEDKEFTLTSYPSPDAEISAFIDGYPCGKFKIDSVRRTLYTFQIDATAIKRTSEIHKTKRNRNFKNTILSRIVTRIAEENNLTPIVKISEEITVENLQQNQQTDAEFLKTLADRWNCYLKIQPDKLFFVERDEFENQEPIAVITENQLIDIDLEDQIYAVFKSCTVYYHDSLKNKDLSYTHVLDVPVGEEIKLHEKVETLEQAKKRAIAELKKRNRWRTSGSVTLEGNMALVAGAVVKLELGDLFTGNYLIEESSHRIDSNGYQTTLNIRRIG